MRKFILLISGVLFIALHVSAQNNVEFTKENLKNDKNLKSTYTKFIKKGDKLYFGHEHGYLVALEYYLMAYEEHPNSAILNYKIADCYLHTLYKYKALPHAQEAYNLNSNVAYNIDYLIGMAYHQRSDFDNAISYYEKFKSAYTGKTRDSLSMADRKITECNNGKELVKEDVYVVVNMGPDINSEYAEYVPLVKSDHSYMLFTSRRPQQIPDPNNTSKKISGERLSKFDLDYHEDIFKTENLGNSKWSAPCRFDYSTRKNSMHDACVSLSYDGQTIFNYRGNNNGDLYTATVEDGKWTKTIPLKGINTKYREDHIAIAYDNSTAYFISDRPGGQGGKDIWKTVKKEGVWSTPENLGPEVNTPYDEEGVFIHPDGNTIYFSSRGHNTMGGFDVFETSFENGKWTTPLNMGAPTNSPDDDVFFILSADGKTAYLSSVKEGGYGMQDIYAITAFEKKKTKHTKNKDPEIVTLKGHIFDKETNKKIKAKIEVVDNSTHEVIYSQEVEGDAGFTLPLINEPSNKDFTIKVTSNGYSEYTGTLKANEVKDAHKNIELEKVFVVSNIMILDHVYFQYNEAEISESSKAELDSAIAVLNAQPDVKIEIEGHTDNVGTDDYNLKLSQKRANAVKAYMISKGFDPKRIVKVTGYGNTQPLVNGDSEDAKQKNRRVEFKLIR
jgi:outer membrane protein OmpA-like peptidoglycan-associated protein